MSSSAREDRVRLEALLVALPFLAVLILAATLLIYSTHWNPGLPLVLSGGLAILAGGGRVLGGSGKFYLPNQEIAVVLLAWLVVSLAVNRLDLFLGIKSLCTLVGALAFFTTAQVGIRSTKDSRRACVAIVALAGLVSLASWAAAAPEMYRSGVLSDFKGPFANPDTFSVVPLSGLCLGCGLVERLSRKWLYPFCLYLGFLALTVLATGCRAAILGCAVGAVVFILFVCSRSEVIEQARSLVLVPLFVCVLVLPLTAFSFGSVAKFGRTLSAESLDLETTRFEVNRYGWNAIWERPIFGGGPGSFGDIYQSFRPKGHDELFIDIAHNDYLEMLVEGGALAGVCWVLVQIMAVRKLYLCNRRGRRPALAAGIACCSIALMVFSVFNFILPERPVFWLFFLILGIASSFPSSRVRYKEKWPLRVAGGFLLLIGGLLSIHFGYKTLVVDSLVSEARSLSDSLEKEMAHEKLEEASQIQPYRARVLLKEASVARSLFFLTGEENWRKEELSALGRATEVAPRNVLVQLVLSDALAQSGQLEEADEVLRRSEELCPFRENVRRKRVDLLLRKGEPVEATRVLFDIVDGRGDTDSARLLKLVVAIARDHPAEAKDLFQDWRLASGKINWLGEFFSAALKSAKKARTLHGTESLVSEALHYLPNDICLRFDAAQLKGRQLGPGAEFDALEELVDSAQPLRGDCQREVVHRYAELLEEIRGEAALESFLDDKVRLHPRKYFYRILLSTLLEKQGNLSRAQSVLRDGLDVSTPSADVYFRLGHLYEKQGSISLAAGYYREALSIEPQHAGASRGLSNVVPPKSLHR